MVDPAAQDLAILRVGASDACGAAQQRRVPSVAPGWMPTRIRDGDKTDDHMALVLHGQSLCVEVTLLASRAARNKTR